MKQDRKISVIVPVYNVEQYLEKCIKSILNQTYTNYELLLIDDGSQDRSSAICDQYAKEDIRIKVVHKCNGGLSDARNVGLDNATGVYVIFIDSDDFIEMNMFEIMMQLICINDADICISSYQDYYEKSPIDLSKTDENLIVEEMGRDKVLLQNGCPYINNVIACGKLYRRSLFEGIRFPYGHIHEDHYTTYKVIYRAERIICTNQKLYNYLRDRDRSITNERPDIQEIFLATEEKLLFYKKNHNVNLYADALYYYIFLFLGNRIDLEFNDSEHIRIIQEHARYGMRIKGISAKKRFVFLISAYKIQICSIVVKLLDFCTHNRIKP